MDRSVLACFGRFGLSDSRCTAFSFSYRTIQIHVSNLPGFRQDVWIDIEGHILVVFVSTWDQHSIFPRKEIQVDVFSWWDRSIWTLKWYQFLGNLTWHCFESAQASYKHRVWCSKGIVPCCTCSLPCPVFLLGRNGGIAAEWESRYKFLWRKQLSVLDRRCAVKIKDLRGILWYLANAKSSSFSSWETRIPMFYFIIWLVLVIQHRLCNHEDDLWRVILYIVNRLGGLPKQTETTIIHRWCNVTGRVEAHSLRLL